MSINIVNTDGTPFNAMTTTVPLGGWEPLGVVRNKCAILSKLTTQVYLVNPADMGEMNLKAMLGADWCNHVYEEFDAKKERMVFNYRRLATDMVRDCQAKGPCSEMQERRMGVFRTDSNELLINGKHGCWYPDGRVLEHGLHEGRVYPADDDVGFDVATPAATEDEIREVLAAFGSLVWSHPLAAELILGWLGVAIVSRALARRPHMLITGPAGCGKSIAMEQIKWLLGNLAYACTGPQTLPAYYQGLSHTSKAVILDEFEADPKKRACQDTFEAARIAYSLQEGDKGIVRGTVTGKARSYPFSAPFVAAGISPGKLEPADLTRWVVLEAKPGLKAGDQMSEQRAMSLGPRLARLFVNRWSAFQASQETVRSAILSKGGDGRMADTVGTLLASYWTFVSERPASADDAAVLADMLDVEARVALHAISDERQCLEALLTKVVSFKVITDDASMVTRNLSIGEAVTKVCDDPTGQPDVVARLAQLGLRVAFAKGKWSIFLASSHTHQGLRKVFSGTKWAAGGWSVVLRRLPGGEESTQRIGVGYPTAKVSVFDVPPELLPVGVGEQMPLAA